MHHFEKHHISVHLTEALNCMFLFLLYVSWKAKNVKNLSGPYVIGEQPCINLLPPGQFLDLAWVPISS